MNLREKLIEVGNEALLTLPIRFEPRVGALTEASTAVLDAILDTLSENADEWKQIAYAAYSTTDPDEFGAAAVAALRDTETEES